MHTFDSYVFDEGKYNFIELCDYAINKLKKLNHRVSVKKFMFYNIILSNIDRQFSNFSYSEDIPGLPTINDTYLQGSSYLLHRKLKLYNSLEEKAHINNFYYRINQTINKINEYKNIFNQNEIYLYKEFDEKLISYILNSIDNIKILNKNILNNKAKIMVEKRLDYIENELKKNKKKHIGLIIMALFEILVLSSDLIANSIAIKDEYLSQINNTASIITNYMINSTNEKKEIEKI